MCLKCIYPCKYTLQWPIISRVTHLERNHRVWMREVMRDAAGSSNIEMFDFYLLGLFEVSSSYPSCFPWRAHISNEVVSLVHLAIFNILRASLSSIQMQT